MKPAVCVIGSSNTDMVIKADKLPAPGETVIGGTFLMNPGGKGANQAVAAARLSSQDSQRAVSFVANVGNDVFGRQARQQFEREGIRTDFVTTDRDEPSGVALIGVDGRGENCIMVASGANARLGVEQVRSALAAEADTAVVLLQLETPLPTVDYAIRQSHGRGMRVVLNPAPAQPLDPALLSCLHVITPNESEAELLLGLPDPYVIPAEYDLYSSLFWWDYKAQHVAGKRFDQQSSTNYPYLVWADDHFYGEHNGIVTNRDYPLSWEAHASQANYSLLKVLDAGLVRDKLSPPHTWHAAEMFLLLHEDKGQARRP